MLLLSFEEGQLQRKGGLMEGREKKNQFRKNKIFNVEI
jgi:hypothetical protein